MKKDSGVHEQSAESSLGERLLFAIWLGGKTLGADNSKQFAAEIGKGAPQLSKWIKEDPRPSWTNIKLIADAVGIDAGWLDDPTRGGATEPPEFAQWLAARRRREQKEAKARKAKAPKRLAT